MSSDDDSDAFENFLSEQKNKVNKRYIFESELEDFKDVDNFITDDESVSEMESNDENDLSLAILNNDHENNSKNKKVILRKKSEVSLFSDFSDVESDENDLEQNEILKNEFNDLSFHNAKEENYLVTPFFKLPKNNIPRNEITQLFGGEEFITPVRKLSKFSSKTIVPEPKKYSRLEMISDCDKDYEVVKKDKFVTPAKLMPNFLSRTEVLKIKSLSRLQFHNDSDSESEISDSSGNSSIFSDSSDNKSTNSISLNKLKNFVTPVKKLRQFSSKTVATKSKNLSEFDFNSEFDSSPKDYAENYPISLQTPRVVKKSNQIIVKSVQSKRNKPKLDFISSLLDNVNDDDRDPAALKYRNCFKKLKQELALKIYHLYNEKAFLNKLPKDIEIIWLPKLLKTAGRCQNLRIKGEHSMRIQLSIKVLTDAERLLKTLVHEMCHGAVWMINKVNDGHGSIWKTWTYEAQSHFPAMTVSTRCHSYKIKTKYEYWCLTCNLSVNRHSKSLDITRKICGKCRGKFTLFVNQANGEKKPFVEADGNEQQLTGFPKFVKEHYHKYRSTGTSHGDVMKILSEKYKTRNDGDILADILNTMSVTEGK